jgi:hypothetical protein
MSKQQLFVKTFETQFNLLKENILKLTNNDVLIRVNFNKLDTLKTAVGMKMIILIFYKELSAFETQLLSRDEKFFLDMSIDEPQVKKLGEMLKSIYIETNQENKDMLFTYVTLLYKLSKKVKELEQ